MNKLIEKELSKVKLADLSNYNSITNEYIIPKYIPLNLKVNSCYIIRLSNSLLFPQDNFVFASNWNKGSVPTHKYYKVQVLKVMGESMVYINGVGYDLTTISEYDDTWSGWLPTNQIEIITQL